MYKLIIADDDANFLKHFYRLVDWKKYDFEVVGMFDNGASVVEYITKNSVDAVITDILMPKKTGVDIAKFVYQRYPNIKVVLFSAYKKFDYAVEALAYDVVGYITKPLSFAQLDETFDKLSKCLSKKSYTNRFISDDLIRERKNLINRYFLDSEEELNGESEILNGISEYSPCCMMYFKIAGYEDYISNKWKHGKGHFTEAFMRIICCENDEYYSVPVAYSSEEYAVLFASKLQNAALTKAPEELKARITECFALKTEADNYQICESMREMKRNIQCSERGFFKNIGRFIEKSSKIENIEKNILEINKYIEENYKNDITRKNIASILYMSERTVDRFMIKYLGCNFGDYLNGARIKKAKELIKDETVSLGELHTSLGYKSRTHFYNTFKQYTGCTPLKYRQKYIKTGRD